MKLAPNRGGARKGAGRKVSAVTRVTREVAEKVLPAGITPLEVLLKTMRALWAEATRGVDEKGQPALDMEKAKEAVAVADRAMAYCHARISSVEPQPERPIDAQDENSLLEDARRLAYTITMGIRERSKLLPKPKKVKA